MLIDLVSHELVAQANASPTSHEFHSALLEQLGRLAPFDSALYLPRAPLERPTGINKPARFGEIYRRFRVCESAYSRDLARARAASARDGAYLDSEIYTSAERRELAFFREILRPQGITSRLVVNVAFRGQVLATVNLARIGRTALFSHAELELAQRMAPLLGLTSAAFEARPKGPVADEVADGPLGTLSASELELVLQLRHGYRNKELAALLHRSPNTVRNQLARIFAKLRVQSRAELAALAARARR